MRNTFGRNHVFSSTIPSSFSDKKIISPSTSSKHRKPRKRFRKVLRRKLGRLHQKQQKIVDVESRSQLSVSRAQGLKNESETLAKEEETFGNRLNAQQGKSDHFSEGFTDSLSETFQLQDHERNLEANGGKGNFSEALSDDDLILNFLINLSVFQNSLTFDEASAVVQLVTLKERSPESANAICSSVLHDLLWRLRVYAEAGHLTPPITNEVRKRLNCKIETN